MDCYCYGAVLSGRASSGHHGEERLPVGCLRRDIPTRPLCSLAVLARLREVPWPPIQVLQAHMTNSLQKYTVCQNRDVNRMLGLYTFLSCHLLKYFL